MSEKQLTFLLTGFPATKAAGAAHRTLATSLSRQGDDVLQTTVLQVTEKRRASVHDPQRALKGMWTSALTWGAFGLVAGTNKVESTLVWAVLGALCGGIYAYLAEHLLKKDELARLGQRLPAPSSALLTVVRTTDVPRLLQSSRSVSPSVASAASVDRGLTASVYAGTSMPVELPHGGASAAATDESSLLSMILVRYPDLATARQVAAAVTKKAAPQGATPQVELVVETRSNGRRRVSDPTQGVAAMSRSDVISWGAFGLVFGAIAGVVGGGGVLGFLEDGLVTGLGWAVFGLAAGALYGLWAGRSISARRLAGIGEILPPGSSALLAWADGPVDEQAVGVLTRPGADRLTLCFNPVPGGAVLATV